MRPIDLGARHQMTFKVVSMQFHKTGGNEITLHVCGTRWDRRARRDIADLAFLDAQAASHHAVMHDQLSICENEVLCHVGVTLIWQKKWNC